MIRKLLFLIVMFSPAAMAQSVVNAATCNRADVNAVINGPTHTAVNGDTIQLPACAAGVAAAWTTGITVPAGIGITIIGNGTPNSLPSQSGTSASCSNTVLTDSLTSGQMFNATPNATAATTRISCINWVNTLPTTGYGSPIQILGTCTASTCPNVRIDNNTAKTAWAGVFSDSSFVILANVFGVSDHNTVGDVAPTPAQGNGIDWINVNHGQWQGVGTWGDNSWATPDTFGTNQAFYCENNLFTFAFCTDTDSTGPAFGGGRFVCRFNTFVDAPFECANHGTDTGFRFRGGRSWEGYGNVIKCDLPASASPWPATCSNGSAWPGRSAVGRSFGNLYQTLGPGNDASWKPNMANLDAQRTWRPVNFNICAGQNPWDINDGGFPSPTQYYPPSGTVTVTGVTTGSTGGQATFVVTDSTATWTANQWVGAAGMPYSFYDVTKVAGGQILASNTNTISVFNGGQAAFAIGDSYQIRRAQVCLDQPGRGQGLLVTSNLDGTNPVIAPGQPNAGAPGPVNEVLDPTYEANDTLPSASSSIRAITAVEKSIMENREYYIENFNQVAQTSATSPFNGTTGTGHGLFTRMPTTCTTGVGYLATDQGSWNTSGASNPLGVNLQGQLYICTATNTWTLSYTPYTYPHALVVATVSVAPSTENFGSVVVGASSATQTATLTNPTAASITITSTTTTGNVSDFPNTANTCSGTIAGNGGTCSVTTKFSPTSTGARSATLTIATSAGSFPVSLSGTGTSAVNPGVSISPAFIAFGNQSVGAPTPGTVVTITSTTSANLVMGTPPATITGTNAGDFNLQAVGGQCSNGQSIPQSSTCIEDVVFLPTATGSRTAQLNIFDNVTGSPQVVTLSGTGVGTIAINPATLNYGLVAQGQTSASQLLTITNNTGVTLSLTGTSFSNTDFASTSNTCNSGSLTNGSSCTATITFRPSATTGTNETGFFNVGYTGVGGSPVQTPLSGTVLPPIATPATNIFASNLAGCGGPPKVATWCFTADRHIYISSCSGAPLVCGPYTPFTLMAQ